MSMKSVLPASWDDKFLLRKMIEAGVNNHIGADRVRNIDGVEELHLAYPVWGAEAVYNIIEAYPVQYAEQVQKARMRAQITELRWQKQQEPTNLNGIALQTDDVTVGRITAAVVLMDAAPNSPQSRRWKINETTWVDVDRSSLVAMGAAIAGHIEACFQNEEALHILVNGAQDINDLAAIDIESGWPT